MGGNENMTDEACAHCKLDVSKPQLADQDIERILVDAIGTLYAEDLEILRRDVAERTICGQLAAIFQRHFDDHDVHVEYNRHGIEPKGIELRDAQGNQTLKRVSPDIVIH